MYGWIWRHLPGPAWLRIILVLAVLVGIVYVLFEFIFPELAPYLPLDETTVEDG